jgi:DNA-binding winged helix-turn-helix (wHTH) protein
LPATSDNFEYQFDGVRVDVAGHRVWVDDREISCPARVFGLLATLCQADGRVRRRDDLLTALWTDDEDVSDESLTQIVFRLRAMLGRHGDAIETVRGVGVRINRPIRRVAFPAATTIQASPSLTAATPAIPDTDNSGLHAATASNSDAPVRGSSTRIPTPESATNRSAGRSRMPWIMATAALLATLMLLGWWNATAPELDWVERGHGVRIDDVHAEAATTVEILRTAFQAEAMGDRARAATLLQSAHDSDRRTPIPAIFLAYFALASGDADSVRDWLAEAKSRVAGLRDPFVDVLYAYVDAEANGSWNDVIRTSGALLDLRPEAWRLHAARAHMLLARGMREPALRELQAIEVTALNHRKIEMVLADRAALGDIEGAEATLARLPQDAQSASLAFMKARIEYSKGDLAAARAGFARAVELGLSGNRLDLVSRSQILGGILAMEMNDVDDARARIRDGLARLLDRRQRSEASDVAMLVVQIEAMGAQPELVPAAIAQVRSLIGTAAIDVDRRAMIELFALRLMGPSGDTGLSLDPAIIDFDRRGLVELLAARRAHARGDTDAASASLQAALAIGVMQTDYAEEARLLAKDLAIQVVAPQPLDPPLGPLSRFASRWALRTESHR